ncbi:MAG TPA: ABC transporter permease, partial [Myxococcaceae bacterium]|nr:ABC transporter permease [Myxococcaceae bacterium]
MRFRIDILEGLRMALFSLRANRLRTVLTTVGIGIGVATLLAIIGIIQGLNTSFANQMATIGSSSLYVSKFPWVIKGDWWQYRNRKDFTIEQMEMIRAQSTYATAVAPVVFRVADVSFLSEQISLVGVLGTREDYLSVTGWELSSGRFLNETDDDNRRSVVVLGMDVVDRLFPNSDPLGASVRIENRPFRVIGVLARRGKILGESQDLRVMIPFKTFWGYFGKRRGFSIGVGVAR